MSDFHRLTTIFLCVWLLSLPTVVDGFVPRTLTTTATTTALHEGKVGSIAHELQDLDDHQKAIQHDVKLGGNKHLHEEQHDDDGQKGFAMYHESRIHKLRRQIHEKDVLLKEALDELESSFDQTGSAIQLAQVAEYNSQKFEHLYEEEHESIRALLWQAVKLATKRVKNGLKRVVGFGFFPFGRSSNKNKNQTTTNQSKKQP
eukprot:CAMPEP_0113472642 /NCGR_PEP_ID=MMETSP0014_2-20120614/17622_1 /TAXON_ID=2857 /ORGANISM="Nitzschia sp." /LENGTH=201 /DNA_ID=CAMNT_0000365361 /DNA_START=159 /DNA_END=764 /DNA_ORIENTATION=+ /assembly_acc=CAM_ASM_000159